MKKKKASHGTYTCACGESMEKSMRAIRAHAITTCPLIKRPIR